MTRMSVLRGSVAVGLIATTAARVAAQTVPVGTADEDIIVTAQKREQKIADVPSSVAVVSATELSRGNLVTLQDLASKVPGLNIVQGSAGPVGVRLILRGQNTGGAGAVVATVVDDIAVSSTSSNAGSALFGSDINTYDMSRIEVLRGPQGTLYGASAEGGLIKYVTNAPDLNAVHASAELLGNTVEHGGEGGAVRAMLNLPLVSGKLALRVAGYDQYDAPWIDNFLGGQPRSNGILRNGGRISLLWKPDDDWTVRLTALIDNIRGRGAGQVEVRGSASTDPFALANGYVFNSYRPLSTRFSAQTYAANIQYSAPFAVLQSITSYGRQRSFVAGDVLGLANVFAPGSAVATTSTYPLRKINQELRISSLPDTHIFKLPVDWQAGAFYTDESVPNAFFYDAVNAQTGAEIRNVLIATGDVNYREFATYADTTVHVLPTVEIEFGGRYFWNNQLVRDLQGGALLGAATPVQQPTKRSSENSGTYSASLKWKFSDDASIYGRVASGYRPGGPVRTVFGITAVLPDTFKSDSTTNYEIGIKGQFLDRLLSLDIAAFRIDWTDVQVNTRYTIGAVTANVVGNGGTARSQGLEWAVSLHPLHGFTVGASGAYTDATLTKDAPGIGGLNGQQLPYVPKFSTNVSAEYDTALTANIDGFAGSTWSYTGARYSDFAAAQATSHLRVPSFSQLELHAGARLGRYAIEVFGRNVTDARGITYYNPNNVDIGGRLGSVGLITPRTIGAKLDIAY